MAHNLEFNERKGTHSMFSVQEIPWHGLGQIVENALTSKQAIEAANLDFEVKKIRNHVKFNGRDIVSPDSYSTLRTDNATVLGTVGNDYTVVQNNEVFEFFDSIVGEGKAIFQTAGVIGKGEQIFVTAKLPKSVVINNIDLIEQYLVLSNTHDGTRSIEVLFTPIRVVCNNTLQAALNSSKNRVRIRHTKSAKEKLAIAGTVLGIQEDLLKNQNKIYNRLAEKQIDEGIFKEYLVKVFLNDKELKRLTQIGGVDKIHKMEELSTQKKNILTTVSKYYVNGPGQNEKGVLNTMWGAYNSITGYYQNVKPFTDTSKKVTTNFYGTNFNNMNKALNIAYDMATN